MPVRFGFLLLRLFPMYVVVLATEALRLANQYAGRRVFDWQFLGDGAAVEASNGIRVDCDAALSEAADLAYAFVVAGDDQTRTLTPRIRSALVRIAGTGTVVGAIDSGTFVLAEVRLIRGRKVTVHPLAASAFREQFPDVALQDGPVVVDGPLITCAGGVATVRLMLTLIERHCGAAVARDVATDLVLPTPEIGSRGRARTQDREEGRDDRLETLLQVMRQSIEAPLSLPALSRRAGLSERQIARLFERAVGEAPMAHYRKLRLNHARQLLFQSSLSISEIALASGFRSVSAFSRCFAAEFGRSPRQLLTKLRDAGHADAVPAENFRKRIRLRDDRQEG